jgi:hypothetical protein
MQQLKSQTIKAIAIAMSPSLKSQLPNHMRPNPELRTYVLVSLPEPFRIYYDQSTLDKEIVLYGDSNEKTTNN